MHGYPRRTRKVNGSSLRYRPSSSANECWAPTRNRAADRSTWLWATRRCGERLGDCPCSQRKALGAARRATAAVLTGEREWDLGRCHDRPVWQVSGQKQGKGEPSHLPEEVD